MAPSENVARGGEDERWWEREEGWQDGPSYEQQIRDGFLPVWQGRKRHRVIDLHRFSSVFSLSLRILIDFKGRKVESSGSRLVAMAKENITAQSSALFEHVRELRCSRDAVHTLMVRDARLMASRGG